MVRMLLVLIILVNLNSKILFGKRRSSIKVLMLTLLKLLKRHKRSLMGTARSRRGNRAGIEFEDVRTNGISRTSYL